MDLMSTRRGSARTLGITHTTMRDFFAFLRKRSTASSDPEPVPASPSRQPQTAETPTARWLSKDDPANPFVFDGYDCLAFVRSMLSVTKDPDVAASFVALRTADGRTLSGTLPEGAVEVSCGITYAFDGELREGELSRTPFENKS